VEPCYHIFNQLNENSVIIDIGLGHDADFSSALNRRYACRCYGVDPTIKHRSSIEASTTTIGEQFSYINAALGAKNGRQIFYESLDNVSGSFYDDHRNITNDHIREYEVAVVTLKDLIDHIGMEVIDLIKIDVEGAEYEVLSKADREIISHFRQMVVEFHHDVIERYSLADTKRIVRRLSGLGYLYYTVDGMNYLFFQEDLAEGYKWQ